MKKARKLITFILTVVMVLSMSMNVWAVDITIDNDSNDSVYEAYRLLNAEDLGGENKFAYTLYDKYASILKNVTGKTNETDIIDYISKLDDGEKVQEFANAVYKEIKEADPAIEADATTTNNVFTGVEQGYYLIAQTKKGTYDDVYSLVMLDTAGEDEIEVTPKEKFPTLEKTITDPDDNISTDGKKNNVSIGSDVQFTLTTTIPPEADYYDYYFCIFSDTLSTGLTFINDGTKDLKVVADTKGDLQEGFDYELYLDANAEGNTFQVALKDAKALAGQKITVTYWAKLNDKAQLGATGNTNTADLVYSNDPNIQYGDYVDDENNPSGKPEPNPNDPDLPNPPMGDTPEQITNTYTTAIKLYKVDENKEALGGATFQIKDAEGNVIDEKTVVQEEGDYVLTFNGLGAGTYTITETDPPEGYNPAADIDVKIAWDGTQEGNSMWTVTVNNAPAGDKFANGVLTLTVENRSGSELPSTGGIGTTIFYIVGGALVLFAVVLLVTKKRMKDNQ